MLNVFDILPDLPTEGLDYKQTATYTRMTLERRLSGHKMVSVLSWILLHFELSDFHLLSRKRKTGTVNLLLAVKERVA